MKRKAHKKTNSKPPVRLTRRQVRITTPVYYPAFLNLKGKRVIVVGGGKVAERKILALLKAAADVTVISPEVTKRIEMEDRRGTVRHVSRRYRKGDQRGALLIIAATDSQDINRLVSRDATCLVNVVDAPTHCNFIVPSVIQRGSLTIAVSTSGISPALSRSIRNELKKHYGPEFARYLELLRKIRKKAMREITDTDKRNKFLKNVASKRLLEILRKKGFKEVEKVLLLAERDAKIFHKRMGGAINK